MEKVKKKGQESIIPYRERLGKLERTRYDEKLNLIDGKDPYEIQNWSPDVNLLPTLCWPDVLNYLILTPSPYTAEDLKCYKGLDAYNQFVCGWVRDQSTCIIDDKHVITAKVLHSQRLSEKPLRPWLITKKTGEVLGAHCTCMAGLGEACTHVASLLFSVEATVKVRDSKTVTEEKSYWLLPSGIKNVSYKEAWEIDFTSAKTMKKKLDAKINSCAEVDRPAPVTATPRSSRKVEIQEPTESELSDLFHNLHTAGLRPAILSIVPEYSDDYIPKSVNDRFPQVLTELRDESAISMNYRDLLKLCDDVKIEVTNEQAEAVENSTRDQANSKLWFRFRAGRITASKMKNACTTDPANPAQSLIKSTCYPDTYKFQNAATKWGCEHEEIARDIFADTFMKEHVNGKIESAGFFINPDVPYIGASPDAIVSCDCCGHSSVEIKCPFCVRNMKLDEVTVKNFCLQQDNSGKLNLSASHQYYYQIQTQLGVCKFESGYFVVWTENDLHIEQILFDPDFWKVICDKSEHVFKKAILPELVGKFFTKLPCSILKCLPDHANTNTSSTCNTSQLDEKWCYCQEGEFGDMVCCDNENCELQWFHYECVGIKNAPKGKWFCPDCRILSRIQHVQCSNCNIQLLH